MIKRELSFGSISVHISRIGEDCCIAIQGGDKPHIGCTVLAFPRPSLAGDGKISCTSSVLNLAGHKDEEICRYLAEEAARRLNVVTVCTGGFHVDHITPEQIREVRAAAKELAEEMIGELLRE